MPYTTDLAVKALNQYLGCDESSKRYIENTKQRGFIFTLDNKEDIVIFVYPLVHKQDNTKNYFDTRDSGAYERSVAWNYALENNLKYFCFGINDSVDKYVDYVFSLECSEDEIAKLSGTFNGVRNGKGNQIIIPNDYIPSLPFERIRNKLKVFISVIHKDILREYMRFYDNRPYNHLTSGTDFSFEISENDEEENKYKFRIWLEQQITDSDNKEIIEQYIGSVSETPLPLSLEKNLFFTMNSELVEVAVETIDDSDENTFKKEAASKYLEFTLAEESDEIAEDIYKHNLFGIHIKEKNDALSETNPHVCIGWSKLGNLTSVESRDELYKIYSDTYPDSSERSKGQNVGQVWRFIKEMNSGDYIVFAENSVFHIGLIESDYCYSNEVREEQSYEYVNSRKVKWLRKNISRRDISEGFHHSLSAGMSLWTLNDYKSAVADLIRGNYIKDNIVSCDEADIRYNTALETIYGMNRIVFGAPGTGKSHQIKKDCNEILKNTDGTYERVTFHPDYTYSQFVGTYKPVSEGDTIKYRYVPGPFMRILVDAYKSGRTDNPQPHVLVIEEINRAKVAAVFGDVFQLLDRDDDGVSEYEIQTSEDIRKYLASELGGEPEKYSKIKLPNNMFIWATMNSADQGVYPMDTAFKRRWNFEYIGIDENEDKVRGKFSAGGDIIEWNSLRKAINAKLSVECRVNEDKLMGPFFISKQNMKTVSDSDDTIKDNISFIKIFKSKVLMYLYEDAAKQCKQKLFSGCEDTTKYSAVCSKFDEIGIKIFGENFEIAE